MKLLRKLLCLIPILAIGLTIFVAFIGGCIGLFGKVVTFTYDDCLTFNYCTVSTTSVSAYSFEYFVKPILYTGNGFAILGFLMLCGALVLCILNLLKKLAKGPWLLIATIILFVAQFILMVRPIILVDIRTTELGGVWEGFGWTTFGFSTVLWINPLILFILNKTLFKKTLAEE